MRPLSVFRTSLSLIWPITSSFPNGQAQWSIAWFLFPTGRPPALQSMSKPMLIHSPLPCALLHPPKLTHSPIHISPPICKKSHATPRRRRGASEPLSALKSPRDPQGSCPFPFCRQGAWILRGTVPGFWCPRCRYDTGNATIGGALGPLITLSYSHSR